MTTICKKCGQDSDQLPKQKYCGDGSDKDNPHSWVFAENKEIENPHDAPEKVQARKDQVDPWIMYLIVKESLGMSAGKIGAQCGHAVGMIYERYAKLDWDVHGFLAPCEQPSPTSEQKELFLSFDAWRNESFRKVVLRASDSEFEKIKIELSCFVVRDAGLTEIPAGSETVIGIWPMKKSQAPKIVKRLQVLK